MQCDEKSESLDQTCQSHLSSAAPVDSEKNEESSEVDFEGLATSGSFHKFLQGLEHLHDVEKKLEETIHFMEVTISQQGSPHFKDFLEARRDFSGQLNWAQRLALTLPPRQCPLVVSAKPIMHPGWAESIIGP